MNQPRKVRDNNLIDGLDALLGSPFDGTVWRVVRQDRDPLEGAAAAGRWDDGTFDVLYTAIDRDGAVGEIYYHLLKGQPVFPSKMKFKIFELKVSLQRVLPLPDFIDLNQLNIETENYGKLDYALRRTEYAPTQELGEAAHFLDFDGLLVPNARWNCLNLVVFADKIKPDKITEIEDRSVIDWDSWRQENQDQFNH